MRYIFFEEFPTEENLGRVRAKPYIHRDANVNSSREISLLLEEIAQKHDVDIVDLYKV